MGGAVTSNEESDDRGVTPFTVFGIGLVVATAWALYMGVAFSGVPNFITGALPTIVGVAIAVAAMLAIALWAPKND